MIATHATVTRSVPLSPGMVRVTLTDPDLAGYRSTGVGDEYVRLHFPEPDGTLPLPAVTASGDWDFGAAPYPHVQPYTIRAHRPGAAEIDIDFVVHGHGRAAAWAAAVEPGHRVLFGAPRSLFEPPAGVSRFVFATDATGLPALARLLEQLDESAEAHAIVELPAPGHEIPLSCPGRLEVRWLLGSGNGVAPSRLAAALREGELGGDAYVWVAGESTELRSARRLLRHELGLPADRFRVIGYWTHLAAAGDESNGR